MATKTKQLYHCDFRIPYDDSKTPYCDFYYVLAYSPCHAMNMVIKHLHEVVGVPLEHIRPENIVVRFVYKNLLK